MTLNDMSKLLQDSTKSLDNIRKELLYGKEHREGFRVDFNTRRENKAHCADGRALDQEGNGSADSRGL